MKKIYLLGALSLLLFSCKNDDDDNTMASIVGDWKLSKIEVVSGSNNNDILYSENVVGCNANTSFEFKNDGNYEFKYYYKSGNQCELDYVYSGLYNYDRTAQTISVKETTSNSSDIYKVEKLNSNELVISELTYDQDNDDIDDKEVYYLHK